jgi:uncharacterized glyoxalase superfamily protein PhnB
VGRISCSPAPRPLINSRESATRRTGGRVFLFLYTYDCLRDCARLKSQGVTFVREPELQPHGRVAVFADLYGNLWDLIESRVTC